MCSSKPVLLVHPYTLSQFQSIVIIISSTLGTQIEAFISESAFKHEPVLLRLQDGQAFAHFVRQESVHIWKKCVQDEFDRA